MRIQEKMIAVSMHAIKIIKSNNNTSEAVNEKRNLVVELPLVEYHI